MTKNDDPSPRLRFIRLRLVLVILSAFGSLAGLQYAVGVVLARPDESYLSAVPVVAHGVLTPVPPAVPMDAVLTGTQMRFRIPEVEVASGILTVENRWDLPSDAFPAIPAVRQRVHGWEAREKYQLPPFTPPPPGKSQGYLFCWLQGPENYPHGYEFKGGIQPRIPWEWEGH